MEIKDKNGNVLYNLEFAHYGEEREIDATDEEIAIAEMFIAMLPSSEGCRIVRKSDAYITLEFGVSDLARIKYTEKARWVNLPIVDLGKVKRRFDDISEVEQFKDDIIRSYEWIKQYT